MTTGKSNIKFKFEKHDRIGEVDALEDRENLLNCFEDTGDLNELRNVTTARSIVLGRTGVGKTALLSVLHEKEEKVAVLSPFDLALEYLTNSVALKFYVDIGVELDLFFGVLWKHVFATELVRLVGSSSGELGINNFFVRIQETVYQKPYQREGQAYLKRYPDFWKNTHVRVQAETEVFEKAFGARVSAMLGSEVAGASGNLEFMSKLSCEQKAEIERIGREVVDRGQIRQLSSLTKLLRDELQKDAQKKYFITIDRLDEPWTNDLLRIKLIRALFETIKTLNAEIRQLKIVCAIREDLLDRVFESTRSQGDQQEKYSSLYLRVYWTHDQLKDVLHKRVKQLFQKRYAKRQPPEVGDVIPTRVNGMAPVTYLISRTLSTPRDVITLFNECIRQAAGKPKISPLHIQKAEGQYSGARLNALADEWSADYPSLKDAALILRGFRPTIKIEELESQNEEKQNVDDLMLNYLVRTEQKSLQDDIYETIHHYCQGDLSFRECMFDYFHTMSKVGLVGVQRRGEHEPFWSHRGELILSSDIAEDTKIHLHPAFYRVLGIRT